MAFRKKLPECIIEEYQSGWSVVDLSKKYDSDVRTIKRFLLDHKVTIRRRLQWGEDNHNWQDGLSRSTVRRYAKLELDAEGIDQHTCATCGKQSETRLQIHHKDSNRWNNVKENLKVLCTSCHRKLHPIEHDELGRFVCSNVK